MLNADLDQGDQLGAFREGIQHGQQFDISLINFQNSPFCLETTDCQNDGYEFIQQDGIFYYASSVSQQSQNQQPQGLNARDTSDDLSASTDNYFFRRYLGVDGVKRLHLPAHPGKSLVGRNVIAADGSEIAIVDEVVS
ncbi:hypothetical protein GTA08_BOTSDO07869 [Neofusicoccum parvum]|nr:hypothetical protein GTA08_BOTSDO07869 [Neofusicoccum parvum]